jgi:DNA invertase Pin-like site-specific DNA recombinase
MKMGYARVSTGDQNPALQLAALKRARRKRIFTDKASGAHVKHPELTQCSRKATCSTSHIGRLIGRCRDSLNLREAW